VDCASIDTKALKSPLYPIASIKPALTLDDISPTGQTCRESLRNSPSNLPVPDDSDRTAADLGAGTELQAAVTLSPAPATSESLVVDRRRAPA
jgi:hypothetical protein